MQRSYRTELDGLRAFAVLAVLVNHLEGSWLPGGFLGVDSFLCSLWVMPSLGFAGRTNQAITSINAGSGAFSPH